MSWAYKAIGWTAAVAVHAALFAWAGTLDRKDPPRDMDLLEVELVELGALRDAPLAPQAGEEGDDPAPLSFEQPKVKDPTPEAADPASTSKVEQRRKEPQDAPKDPPPDAVADAADPPTEPAADAVADAAEPPEAEAEPTRPRTSPLAGSTTTVLAAAPSGVAAGRKTEVRGSKNHSAYGSKIVKIVLDELDRDPVRGIGRKDMIQVLLEVLPNGDLAWRGDGRFGFARVLRSSLGRLRTRQVLRRIERASLRFPKHPKGFARRHYVIDVTVNFRDLG